MKKTHKIFGKEFVTISKEEYEEIKQLMASIKTIARGRLEICSTYEYDKKVKDVVPALEGTLEAIDYIADKVCKNLDA